MVRACAGKLASIELYKISISVGIPTITSKSAILRTGSEFLISNVMTPMLLNPPTSSSAWKLKEADRAGTRITSGLMVRTDPTI